MSALARHEEKALVTSLRGTLNAQMNIAQQTLID